MSSVEKPCVNCKEIILLSEIVDKLFIKVVGTYLISDILIVELVCPRLAPQQKYTANGQLTNTAVLLNQNIFEAIKKKT